MPIRAPPAEARRRPRSATPSVRIVRDCFGGGWRRVLPARRCAGWEPITHQRQHVGPARGVVAVLAQAMLRRHHCLRPGLSDRSQPPLEPRILDRLAPAWVADLTSIRVATTVVSLAGILDAFTRRCVGWPSSGARSRRVCPWPPWRRLSRSASRRAAASTTRLEVSTWPALRACAAGRSSGRA
jgi:hypothetical protein